MNARDFLMKLAREDGRVVSTGDLHEMQISEARVNDRMFVDDKTGLGFVILPWKLTTDKDTHRERVLRRQFCADSGTAPDPSGGTQSPIGEVNCPATDAGPQTIA